MAQNEDLDTLKNSLSQLVSGLDSATLDELRAKFLGADGILSTLMKNLGKFPADQRKERGEALNRFKQDIHALLGA